MDRYIEFVTNHWLLFIALMVVTFLLLQELFESALRKFEMISPILVVAKMNNEDPVILDVREANEFKTGHIEGAINTPLSNFDKELEKLSKFKNKALIVVCQTGTRSTTACKKLTSLGFEKVFSMIGGMQAWEESKYPITKSK
jgi:rhodanese-related sulfurtransferase